MSSVVGDYANDEYKKEKAEGKKRRFDLDSSQPSTPLVSSLALLTCDKLNLLDIGYKKILKKLSLYS